MTIITEPYPRFSEQEMTRRYVAVQAAMQAHDLAALVLYGTSSSQYEVQYLSNFPTTWETMLVFPVKGEPTLLLELYNHVPNARAMASITDVRWGGPDLAASTAYNLQERGLGTRRVGLVGMIPYQRYETLKRVLPQAVFIDFTSQLLELRLIKSQEEIAFQRIGAELSDRAIQALEREARPGITEHQLAAIVEGAYLGQGGKNNIHFMATTPMERPTICVPAQYHSNRVLEQGDVLITEISAQYMMGYPGQILRPFAIGAPPAPAYRRLYDAAVEAYDRIASVIRAGATVDDVLDAAEYIHAAGYSIYDDLVHSYGGGYLPPILRTRRTSARPPEPFTFKDDMTIVIQPNVITGDERMGVQVGELCRVTRAGVQSLHRFPMRFIECG